MARQEINNSETGVAVRTKINQQTAELYGDQTVTGAKTYADGKLIANEITAPQDFTVKTGVDKTMVLEQYVWRDEYPNELIAAGAAAAPEDIAVTVGGVQRRMRSFDGNNTEERLSGSFEIPHDMAIDTLALPELHVHWRPSTTGTGTVKWFSIGNIPHLLLHLYQWIHLR